MPLRTPNLLMTLGFCQWYKTTNSAQIGFNINSFGLKWISQQMKQKVTAKGEDKRVRVPGILEFIATAENEASEAESPRFEDVVGAEVPRDAPSGEGTTPMEEIEVEEEEEKDPDIHFQRKQKGEACIKRVVKKPRRHTPVIAESELVAVSPTLSLLVIKLSAQKEATEKAAPSLGKISSLLQDFFNIFLYLYAANLLICATETEVVGEQRDYYDPLFTYREGDEASYFVISDKSEGGAVDVGPSGASEDKESPMASSSREQFAEPAGSEGELDIAPATEAPRTDEVLPETTSGASPATARVSSMEPIGVSTVVEGAPEDIVVEAVGAMSVMTSTPLGNIIVTCK